MCFFVWPLRDAILRGETGFDWGVTVVGVALFFGANFVGFILAWNDTGPDESGL